MSTEVQKRIEEIRRKREEEANTKKKEILDQQITWEAEAILAFEDVDFMNELTDNMDLYNYVQNKLRKHDIVFDSNTFNCIYNPYHECNNRMINVSCRRGGGIGISASSYHDNITVFPHNVKGYKIKILLEKIRSVKESPEYKQKEEIRKKQEDFERLCIDTMYKEEQRIINEKAFQEEQVRRQQILDETNKAINIILQNTKHTFTDLILADWDKRYEKEFVFYNKQWGWAHYTADTNNKRSAPCYTGMHSSFEPYYEEGKVPFFTKCPTCKSPTKFNYMNKVHYSHMGGCDNQKSCGFKEVYCDKHYFYDSSTNKHYLANPSGMTINLNHPMEGSWVVNCWKPENTSTKWAEWDPSDPDGSKAMAEKKQKEADEVQRQIAELQAKLASLQS